MEENKAGFINSRIKHWEEYLQKDRNTRSIPPSLRYSIAAKCAEEDWRRYCNDVKALKVKEDNTIGN